MSDGTIQVKRFASRIHRIDDDALLPFAHTFWSHTGYPQHQMTAMERLEFDLWEVQEEIDKLESRKDDLLARIAYANMRGRE